MYLGMPLDNSCTDIDKELIVRCTKYDRKAQRELYERYSSRMYSLCLRYSKDKESAKDVLQDGFVTVFTKIGTYKGIGAFEGWMRRIFVNTALMRLRKADIFNDIEDISYKAASDEDIAGDVGGKEIMKIVSSMPAGFRTVFNMSVVDGYSHREIAGMLGITEGASRSQLSRARLWLQKRLSELNMTVE